jgi:hypothetical protein
MLSSVYSSAESTGHSSSITVQSNSQLSARLRRALVVIRSSAFAFLGRIGSLRLLLLLVLAAVLSRWCGLQYGHPRRSTLVIIERAPNTPRRGYSAQSYMQALTEGLLSHWRRSQLFRQYLQYNNYSVTADKWGEFCKALQKCWRSIPGALIQRLITSMLNRTEACRRAGGWQTHYYLYIDLTASKNPDSSHVVGSLSIYL